MLLLLPLRLTSASALALGGTYAFALPLRLMSASALALGGTCAFI